MLVFSRKIGESFRIDGAIHVEILEYARGQVRVGITAPPEVKVLRSELLALPEDGGKPAAGSEEASGKQGADQEAA